MTTIGNNPGVSIPQIPTAAQPTAATPAQPQVTLDGFETGGQAANSAVNPAYGADGIRAEWRESRRCMRRMRRATDGEEEASHLVRHIHVDQG